MSKYSIKSFLQISVCGLSLFLANGCAVSANDSTASEKQNVSPAAVSEEKSVAPAKPASKHKIPLTQGSPADTVRIFYKNLRERRFREAMMMTNLRYAVEGLSDAEMQDLNGNFEPLAAQVPAEIEINGEIITNNLATVTARLPDNDTGRLEITQIQLRREKDQWVVITAEKDAEALAKKEGKNYFFVLRMDVHHGEAEVMMQRIAKAQSVYAMQNGGTFTDLATLVSLKLLPEDINNSQSTGYRFNIILGQNNKKYYANGIPETYGRTGKISYLLESDTSNQNARLNSKDNKGQPLKK
jgi:hypothetical protein